MSVIISLVALIVCFISMAVVGLMCLEIAGIQRALKPRSVDWIHGAHVERQTTGLRPTLRVDWSPPNSRRSRPSEKPPASIF